MTILDDPTDLHVHELEAEDARIQAEAREARERDDMRWLMSHAAGRRLVWRWLSAAGIFRTTFVSGRPDDSAYNEGRRAVGLALLDEVMRHAPTLYVKMTEENTG